MKSRALAILTAVVFTLLTGCATANMAPRPALVSSSSELPDYSMFVALEVPVDTDKDGKPELYMRFLLDPAGTEKSDFLLVFSDKNRREYILTVINRNTVRALFTAESNGWRRCVEKSCDGSFKDFFTRETKLKDMRDLPGLIRGALQSLAELSGRLNSKSFF